DDAGVAAAVAGRRVAVVALLAGGDAAVAAAGRRAVRVAAVAVDDVAVVAVLVALLDAVTACLHLTAAGGVTRVAVAAAGAAVAAVEVPVVATLRSRRVAVAADGG